MILSSATVTKLPVGPPGHSSIPGGELTAVTNLVIEANRIAMPTAIAGVMSGVASGSWTVGMTYLDISCKGPGRPASVTVAATSV